MDLQTAIAERGAKAIEYMTQRINELVFPEHPLREAVLHYPKGGGKGFRPAMLQLVCGALNGKEEQAIPVSAAIEAVHVSSLIHDDWMDHDETRRGLPAVWKQWNPTIAILAGDVLFGVAFTMAGEIDDIDYDMKYRLATDLAKIYIQLCHGQMLDIDFTETYGFDELTIEEIEEMQYLKTGVLFEFSCVTGARIALNRWEDPIIDKIRNYAKSAGTAFQIQDDIIGLLGKEEEIGKPVGSDIKEGKRTITAIHAIQHANPQQKEILNKALGNPDATNEEIEMCMQTMKEIGSIDYAKSLAIGLANKAVAITSELPNNENTKLLQEFAQYMIDREL